MVQVYLYVHSPHLGQILKYGGPLRVPGKSSKGQASEVHITSEGWRALKEEDGTIT